ncbi:response regulator [Nonomuraea sediminis]|uniref:response regulator n=1 Tax=Nonomuraea sediminis TaxID=2835864 RepID=UPI001BDCCA2C|nr:response regulator transcription factor [Nonomuraea sediminis]
MTIRVLVADDQAMVRASLRVILDDQPGISVVGEAGDGDQALALARELRPDVCLVDVQMPGLDGLEVTRALAGSTRVIVVTTFDLDEYVHEALRGGAVGFVLKDAGPGVLVEAVRAASVGDALISPSITLRLLRRFTRPAGRTERRLSDREIEVVRAVARGRTNQEIAAELFISLSTVKGHVSLVQAKLGLRNRVEIAAWAWENGYACGGPR